MTLRPIGCGNPLLREFIDAIGLGGVENITAIELKWSVESLMTVKVESLVFTDKFPGVVKVLNDYEIQAVPKTVEPVDTTTLDTFGCRTHQMPRGDS